MTTLVSGATGRLGSRFVPRLLAEGERVRVVVRNAEAAEALRTRGAETIVGDLRDPETREEAVDGGEEGRAVMGEDRARELRTRGADMDWDQAIAYTLTQTTQALNELQSGTQP